MPRHPLSSQTIRRHALGSPTIRRHAIGCPTIRRHAIPIVTVALAAATLAACGSSSSSLGGVRATELSYFPAHAPFVLSVETDPNSSAVKDGESLLGHFPIITAGEQALTTRLQQAGIDYQRDIRPLFGNPAMLGFGSTGTYAPGRSNLLVVWVTKDAGKLGALVGKLHLPSVGKHGSATLYGSSGGTALAIDGATVVFGGSAALVGAALDRHAGGGGMSASEATRDLAGLPQNTLISAFGDLTSVLAGPRAARARRVPWVAAIRGYGAAVSATSSGLSYRYRLDTSGASLSSSQLPLAGGGAAPAFAGGFPITFGLKDPAQVVSFAESALQQANPAAFARFASRQATVRARTGVDLTSLLRLLTGDLILGSDTRTTIARVGVSDPATAASDLAKLSSQPRASGISRGPDGLYSLKQGSRAVTLGVIGNQLVAGRASVGALRAFAAAPTAPAAGAQGGLAFRISLAQLLRAALRRVPSKPAQSILSSLGVLSGWTAASAKQLTGSATLALG